MPRWIHPEKARYYQAELVHRARKVVAPSRARRADASETDLLEQLDLD